MEKERPKDRDPERDGARDVKSVAATGERREREHVREGRDSQVGESANSAGGGVLERCMCVGEMRRVQGSVWQVKGGEGVLCWGKKWIDPKCDF